MNNIKQKIWANIFIIYTRYLIGGAFVFASVIKIKGHRFTTNSGENEPIHSAFHYFETMYQSGIYWQFIGLGQLMAGALLMTQRYAKLGALVYFPIILNIFVVTISYDFGGTPVITGLMLLANLLLIYWDWDELKILINLPITSSNMSIIEKHTIWEIIGFMLLGFTFIYRLLYDKYNVFLWMATCFFIGAIGFWIGLRKIR
jgi:hypothetical protein